MISGLGGEALRGYDILIEGGKIVKVGKSIAVPKKSKIIDATGRSVIPGLIDMHGHLYALGASQTNSFPYLYLAGGVTTIFSPGELDPEKVLVLREEIKNGISTGPDIFFAGPYFDSYNSVDNWMHPFADSLTLITCFEKWKNHVNGIKVYSHITKEHFDLIIRKAHENNLIVTGHLGSLSTRYAVENGITGLEHGLMSINDFGGDPNNVQHVCEVSNLDLNSAAVQNLIDLIVAKNVYVDPTMAILESMTPDHDPIVDNVDDYLTQKAKITQRQMDIRVSKLGKDSCVKKALLKQMEFVKLVFDKKGLLVAGTDPVSARVLPGFGIKREIKLFVLSGIPVVEAIRIASLNGAQALRIADVTGSIEQGKNADILILKGDITQNIDLLGKPELVLKHGKIFNPDSLLSRVKGKVVSGN